MKIQLTESELEKLKKDLANPNKSLFIEAVELPVRTKTTKKNKM